MKFSTCLLITLTNILDQLKQICKEYFDRMYMCESQKYDMEFEVRKRGFEVLSRFKQTYQFQKNLNALQMLWSLSDNKEPQNSFVCNILMVLRLLVEVLEVRLKSC